MNHFTDALFTLVSWLENYMNWYVILICFLLVYKLVSFLIWLGLRKESKKRRNILDELHEIKHSLLPNQYTDDKQKGLIDEILFLSTAKLKLTEEQINDYREKGTQIIKKHKGKPFLFIFGFLLQMAFLIFLFTIFWIVDPLDYHYFFPVSAIIITFFGNVSKNSVVFFGILSALLFWLYTNLNGTIVVFLFYLACFNLLQKWAKKIFKKRINKDKSENNEGVLK